MRQNLEFNRIICEWVFFFWSVRVLGALKIVSFVLYGYGYGIRMEGTKW